MSTYMYLKCIDHDPPIRAREESGQHYYDLPRIRAEVADRHGLVARLQSGGLPYQRSEHYDNYFPRNTALFLRDHPKCHIRIETEYGEDVTENEEGENR